MCMCVCVSICTWVQVPIEARGIGSHEDGGLGSCEPLAQVMGAGRRPSVFTFLCFPVVPRFPKLLLLSTCSLSRAGSCLQNPALDLGVSGRWGLQGLWGSEIGHCPHCKLKVAKVGKWVQRGLLGFLQVWKVEGIVGRKHCWRDEAVEDNCTFSIINYQSDFRDQVIEIAQHTRVFPLIF